MTARSLCACGCGMCVRRPSNRYASRACRNRGMARSKGAAWCRARARTAWVASVIARAHAPAARSASSRFL